VTTSTVAALLTILGFSLYDTIIVFDRIRENVPRMPSAAVLADRQPVHERGHRALAGDQLLHELPVLALFLFGGETLRTSPSRCWSGRSRAPTPRSSSPARC
jgi:SecD/SecF fusion protein